MSRPANNLKRVRDQIAANQAALRAIHMQPRSRADVAAGVTAAVDQWQVQAAATTVNDLAASAAGQAVEMLSVQTMVVTSDGPVLVSLALGPLLVQVLGAEVIRDALMARIDTVPTGEPRETRAATITRLESEIETLSIEEEGLIRERWAAGDFVEYRPDADPRHALTWRAVP